MVAMCFQVPQPSWYVFVREQRKQKEEKGKIREKKVVRDTATTEIES